MPTKQTKRNTRFLCEITRGPQGHDGGTRSTLSTSLMGPAGLSKERGPLFIWRCHGPGSGCGITLRYCLFFYELYHQASRVLAPRRPRNAPGTRNISEAQEPVTYRRPRNAPGTRSISEAQEPETHQEPGTCQRPGTTSEAREPRHYPGHTLRS